MINRKNSLRSNLNRREKPAKRRNVTTHKCSRLFSPLKESLSLVRKKLQSSWMNYASSLRLSFKPSSNNTRLTPSKKKRRTSSWLKTARNLSSVCRPAKLKSRRSLTRQGITYNKLSKIVSVYNKCSNSLKKLRLHSKKKHISRSR